MNYIKKKVHDCLVTYTFAYSRYDTSFQEACVSLLNRWEQWNGTDIPFKKSDLAGFETSQKIQFLALLLKSDGFNLEKIKIMQDVYDFNNNGNCEILLRYENLIRNLDVIIIWKYIFIRWFLTCVKFKWLEQLDHVFKFINTTGRMKYVRPLYR